MKKLKQLVGIIALAGLLMFSNVPVFAQDTARTSTTTTTNDMDDMDGMDGDDDKDYGWIGLLGLAGLAGLLKRDRHVHTDTDRRTTTGPNTGTTNR